MRIIPLLQLSILILVISYNKSFAQFIVFDPINTSISEKTANNTLDIISINRDTLSKVDGTLKAITGDRTSESNQIATIFTGNKPALSGIKAFNDTLTATKAIADLFKTTFVATSESNSAVNSAATLKNSASVGVDISAFVKTTADSLKIRSNSLEQASKIIGQTKDLKGSIDQTNQIMLQIGILQNQAAAIANTAVASTEVANQRANAAILGSKQSMQPYDN
ncbi:MAG: hypothetical protein ACTHLK_08535 [Brucella intermedia]